MAHLDAIDTAILKALQQNGRISNAELAERVGLSPSACSRRLDILEKSGTVTGYHARVSPKALDYKMIAIVHISLSGQFAKTLAEFEAAVKLCPNVLVCYLMSGEYDYILRVAAKDVGAAPRREDQLELRATRDHRSAECRGLGHFCFTHVPREIATRIFWSCFSWK
jgi:DNA-binding Lrp family transcriptional regulator